MNLEEQAAEILETAADILASRGWTKYSIYDQGTDSHCAIGAIRRATRPEIDPWEVDCFPATFDQADYQRDTPYSMAIGVMQDRVGHYIGSWNDDHTAEEVIDTLKLCAKDLRNGERCD
jgi:hypothetical protein